MHKKNRVPTETSASLIIEVGGPPAPKQFLDLEYQDIEAQAQSLYDQYHADGISLLRAIEIVVAKFADDPNSGAWHSEDSDHARVYVPKKVKDRYGNNIPEVWTWPRAKSSHAIVRTLRARMRNKNS